jgi:hypothetical protein
MIRFLADEDFNNDVLRGLQRRVAHVDVVRVQDVGLRGASDAEVLAFAAVQDRVLLTHDVSTLIESAFQRTREGVTMPGVIAVAQLLPIGPAIADLVLIAECGTPEDCRGHVWYLPLR